MPGSLYTPATILKYGDKHDRDTAWTHTGNHVGNGPFMLKAWRISDIVIIEKNPHYWDAEVVKLKEIHFFPMNGDTEERAFRADQLHMTEAVPGEKIAELQAENDPYLCVHPYLGTYYYTFNLNVPPFNDKRIRKALSLAIDRQAIVDHVNKRGQLPAYYFTPPNTAGYTCTTKLEENIEEARRTPSRSRLSQWGRLSCDGASLQYFRRPSQTRSSHPRNVERKFRHRYYYAQPGVEGLPNLTSPRRLSNHARWLDWRLPRPLALS